MYENHFSFKYKPFELVPNPDFLFLSSTHKKALTYLDYGIKEKIGFILLTGEIGSGKTTIIRNLIKTLNSSVKLSRVSNTKVTSEQLISMINEDFGMDIEGKSKTRLLSELNEFLIEQYARKVRPILLIDEAQNLSPELLEEVRMLSNLETDKSKLLQIILVGQPELKKTLTHPDLVQLRQRININYHITPLTIDETAMYIKHRLTVAGNPDAISRDKEVVQLVYQFSRGIPRLINILCDFALLSAFVEGNDNVKLEIVRDVAKDLESHNYWDENKDDVSGKESSENSVDLRKDIGSIAIRLIKLEETIKKNSQEIAVLNEKVGKLEEDLSRFSCDGKSAEIRELLDWMPKLEKIVEIEERHNIDVDHEKQDNQVDSLKRIIADINSKLKNV